MRGLAAERLCQENVTTSSFAKSSGCAKAADVASQIVRPSRSR